MNALARRLRDFLAARSGNFAVIGALTAIPLVLMMGGTIDLSRLQMMAGKAQDAAEAAALAAAIRLQDGTVDQAKIEAQMFGRTHLTGDLAGTVLTEKIDVAGGKVTVTAEGSITPSFLKLANINKLSFERKAISSIRQEAYVEVHLLLDVSESMNIAASDIDRQKLERTTQKVNGRPCAFACHVVETWASPLSVYEMNNQAGIDKAALRIDVVRAAATQMIQKLLAKNNDKNSLLKIKIQTATFGDGFSAGTGPSTNETDLIASIGNSAVANGHTNFKAALDGLSAQLGQQGDGRTEATPTKVALMITDGVKDEFFGTGGLGPISPTPLCQQIKGKGMKFAVLEIKYVGDEDRFGYFRDRVKPYYSQISPNLVSCASEGLHDMATDANQSAGKLLGLIEKLVVRKLRVAG